MDDSLLSVASLHALAYCERLFYLEEVERIRVADAAVFAGRALHAEIEAVEDGERWEKQTLESEGLGIRGAVDVLRRRDGRLLPYEHKRGRAAGRKGAATAWETDRIQVAAYAMLIEEATGQAIEEGRVRYHASNATVRVPIDAALRSTVRAAIARANALRRSVERPPVTDNAKLCLRCSLATACLPEEARLAADADFHPIRLLPAHETRRTLHVLDSSARVGGQGEELVVDRGETKDRYPIAEIGSLVVYGFAQVSTQTIRKCAEHDVQVHWMTQTGGLVSSLAPTAAAAQRHVRQFEALRSPETRLSLARRLVQAKVSAQLRYLLRATRSGRTDDATKAIEAIRSLVRSCAAATSVDVLRGLEGMAARDYFGALPGLLSTSTDERLRMCGRNRRPPRDRFNALLSFGYGALYRRVLAAIVAVGLHPGLGFFHELRGGSHPLVSDLMEMFRVPLVDMAIVAAINRRTFDPDADFRDLGGRVLLTAAGRVKAVEVFERRLAEEWKHDVVRYSLSYARILELEVRLLEKEWTGEGGLFARLRIR